MGRAGCGPASPSAPPVLRAAGTEGAPLKRRPIAEERAAGGVAERVALQWCVLAPTHRALLATLALLGCQAAGDAPGRGPRTEAATSAASTDARAQATATATSASATATATSASATTTATSASATAGAIASEAVACRAPSLALHGRLDARDEAALARCEDARTGPIETADRCGREATEPLDLAYLDRAVPTLDEATRAHVRSIATRGRALGRNPRAFELVGDSMTVSGAFMRSFRAPRLAPAVQQALRLEGSAGTVIDHYRGAAVQRVPGGFADSFYARRAAQVGARAAWALAGGAEAPLPVVTDELSPAIAVVLFGGNDAAFEPASIEELSARFERDFEPILDFLEERGVVPVLSTLARHGVAPWVDDCGAARKLSHYRIAVQTNAVSARVAEIACRRRLPLVDLRWALDAAYARGLGPDGVHPSTYGRGGDVLDAHGLGCGSNVRNYVTLRMLAALVPLLAG